MQRSDISGTARFVTFSCYHQLGLFNNNLIKDLFVTHLNAAIRKHEIELIAWVVMPEHVHLIVHSDRDKAIPQFLQSLKDPFARQVIKRWRSLGAAILGHLQTKSGQARFWQTGGGYDRNVLGPEVIEKIQYIHRNPITRGLSVDSVS